MEQDDLSGQRRGILTIVCRVENTARWLCRCDCGRERELRDSAFRHRNPQSCGCNQFGMEWRAKQSAHSKRHGHAWPVASPTYRSWSGMVRRCTKPDCREWSSYGGRGIKVCDRWRESFEDFLADMGVRPVEMTIDRIDNDGNYEPGNVRWATRSTQQRNRRNTVLTHDQALEALGRMEHGERQKDVATRMNCSQSLLSHLKKNELYRCV